MIILWTKKYHVQRFLNQDQGGFDLHGQHTLTDNTRQPVSQQTCAIGCQCSRRGHAPCGRGGTPLAEPEQVGGNDLQSRDGEFSTVRLPSDFPFFRVLQ